MSHRPSCPCAANSSTAFYAICECAAIDQREHTEALNRHAEALREATTQERETTNLHPDTALIDYLAAHWDSQRTGYQPILRGRAINNPTGSFRDALRTDIARRDVGAT